MSDKNAGEITASLAEISHNLEAALSGLDRCTGLFHDSQFKHEAENAKQQIRNAEAFIRAMKIRAVKKAITDAD